MKWMSLLKALLLDNGTWKQVVIKNTIWASVAEGVVRVLKLVVVLFLVRYFGPTEYGKFAFAFSFAAMIGVIFDSGLVLTATREFSMNRENERFLPDIILMRCVLGVLGMAIIMLGMWLITEDVAIRAMMFVLGFYLFVSEFVNLSYAIFRARQRFEYECCVRIVQAIILLAGVGLVIWKAPSVLNVGYAYLASGILTLAVVLVAVGEKGWQPGFRLRGDVWRRFLRVALPLALAGGVGALYMNIDSVMLGYWGQITETGWYSAAAKANGIALVPMSLLTLVTFPAFASTSLNVDATFEERWDTWTAGMIAIGAFFGSVVLAVSDRIVGLAFGDAFRPAALVLQILILTAVLNYAYTPCYQAMILFNEQKRLFWILLSGAVINVILNAILIPLYSLYGAAWATVATHLVILCGLFLCAARYTPVKPINRALFGAALRSVTSGVLAFLAMRATGGSLWVSVPVGAVVFLACEIALWKTVDMMATKRSLPSARKLSSAP